MTLKFNWQSYAIVIAAIIAGFSFGRLSAPIKTLERDSIVTVDREVSSSWRAYVGATVVKTRKQTNYKTITRWLPNGTVEQSKESQKVTASDESTAVTSKETATHKADSSVEKIKLAESKPASTILGASAGLKFPSYERTFRIDAAKRIIGPVFIGAWGGYPYSAGISSYILF